MAVLYLSCALEDATILPYDGKLHLDVLTFFQETPSTKTNHRYWSHTQQHRVSEITTCNGLMFQWSSVAVWDHMTVSENWQLYGDLVSLFNVLVIFTHLFWKFRPSTNCHNKILCSQCSLHEKKPKCMSSLSAKLADDIPVFQGYSLCTIKVNFMLGRLQVESWQQQHGCKSFLSQDLFRPLSLTS